MLSISKNPSVNLFGQGRGLRGSCGAQQWRWPRGRARGAAARPLQGCGLRAELIVSFPGTLVGQAVQC